MKSLKLEEERKYGKHFVEIGILIMIANVMTAIFLWQSILHDWKVTGGEYFPLAFIKEHSTTYSFSFNVASGYVGFLRLIFSFLGNMEELVLISNLILQLSGVLFFYFTMRKIGGVLMGGFLGAGAAVLSILFFPTEKDLPLHFLWFCLSFTLYVLIQTGAFAKEKEGAGYIFFPVLQGGICGIFLLFDISGILLLITMFIVLEKNGLKIKRSFAYGSVILGTILPFAVVVSRKKTEAAEAFGQFYGLWQEQIIFYGKNKNNSSEILALCFYFVFLWVVFLLLIFSERKNKQVLLKEGEIGGEEIKEREKDKEAELSLNNLMVISKNENGQEDKQEEKIKLLHNPLPLPKKHVKKEMKYAFEPTKEQMYYDLNNYDVNDDYDLK